MKSQHVNNHPAAKGPLIVVTACCLCALLGTGSALNAATVPPEHDEARCVACHAGGAATARDITTVTAKCLTCHQPDTPPLAATSFHNGSRNRCLECHSFHEPERIAIPVDQKQHLSRADLRTPVCRSCHDSRGNLSTLSAAHRKAAALYHAQASTMAKANPSQTCLNCHSNQSASTWQDQTDGAVIAFNEHASHPYSFPVIPGSGDGSNWIAREIDPRLPLFAGRMECQTCHLLTADNDDLMIPFPTKYDLCKGCHRHYGDQDPALVVARATP